MARFSGAEPVLQAAERWKQDCLLNDGSVFLGPNRSLWTLENFKYLDTYYSQNLDLGEGNFRSKLKAQLEPTPPEPKQLAAELLWVLYLIASESFIGAKTKRYQIKQIWEWSGVPLPTDSPALGSVLAAGVANPGTAYHTHRWRELLFAITLFRDWKGLKPEERVRLLEDPWVFAEWLEGREHCEGRQFRHVILFFLFPDTFDRIASVTHKREIVRQFRERWGEDSDEIDPRDRVALDRDVARIRGRLEKEYPGEEVDFYKPPVEGLWRKRKPEAKKEPPEQDPPPAEAAQWLRANFGNARVWTISAGEGGRMWDEFQEEGIIAIGWDHLGDLSEYGSGDAIRQALSEHDGRENPTNDTLACWQFSSEIKEGDLVLAKHGRSSLLGWGRVTGPYRHEPERLEYKNVIPVEWKRTGRWTIPDARRITPKTLTEFTSYAQWVKWALDLMEDRPTGTSTTGAPQADGGYSKEDALKDLFLSTKEFSDILDVLERRKNVILQGPPGVGKTFIADRIAWTLMRQKDPARLEFVQFHQSYAYEDFLQGWRPTENGGFVLRNGVFHRFCEEARSDSGRPHVFVIDEINRGNLSRIFGELMMLIEADKRGRAIPLTYSPPGEQFSIPPNLYLIGLMNTADRSLAMVDYALRRRFGFVSLEPAYGRDAFSEFLLEAGVDEDVVKFIEDRMGELNQAIREDRNLGPGFEVGHSYFVPTADEESLDEAWYRGVVETEILPLLREYWFDAPNRVEEFRGKLLR
jgi:5-methylcytosine-specific restriction enzyme B